MPKKADNKSERNSGKNKNSIIPRVSTGIPGLDRLIQGGFVKGAAILVSGNTGAGKTIFCLQYLYEGLKKGESCVYISFEESAKDIKEDAKVLGMDFESYEKKGKFKIVEKNVFESSNIDIFEIDKLKASRVVIDPFSLLAMTIENQPLVRQKLYETIKLLKERGITIVLTSESIEDGQKFSRYGVEEFVADGVILLKFTPIGAQAGRHMFIRKMRRTKHSEDMHPLQIAKGGIKILSL